MKICLQFFNIGGRIGFRTRRMPQRSFPATVRSRELLVDRVEGVFQQRVWNGARLAIRFDDFDGLHGSDFFGRDRVSRPVPVRCAKIGGSGFPLLLVDAVLLGDFYSMGLKNLL